MPLSCSKKSDSSIPHSPELARALRQRKLLQRSRASLSWFLVDLVVTCLLYLDISMGFHVAGFVSASLWPFRLTKIAFTEVIICVEIGCFVITAFSTCYRFGVILLPLIAIRKPIELYEEQRKLLGLDVKDPGFRFLTPKVSPSASIQASPDEANVGPASVASGFNTNFLNLDWLFQLRSPFDQSPAAAFDRNELQLSLPYTPSGSLVSCSSGSSRSRYTDFGSKRLLSSSWESSFNSPYSSNSPTANTSSLSSGSPGGRFDIKNSNVIGHSQLAASSSSSFPVIGSMSPPLDHFTRSRINSGSSWNALFQSDPVGSPLSTSDILSTLRRARSASPFLSNEEDIHNQQQLLDYLNRFEDRDCIPGSTSFSVGTYLIDEPQRTEVLSLPTDIPIFHLDSSMGDNRVYYADSAVREILPQHVMPEKRHIYMNLPALEGQKYHLSTPIVMKSSATGCVLNQNSPTISHVGSKATSAGCSIYDRFGLDEAKIDIYIENLRIWITRTIIKPVTREIDKINEDLRRSGRSEVQIGDVSLNSLYQLMATKFDTFPTLAKLIPYLEISVDQAYLVERLRQLSEDSCMGQYRWETGSVKQMALSKEYQHQYSAKSHYQQSSLWVHHHDHPSDPELILHIIATYMDVALPPSSLVPDGNIFSTLYLSPSSSMSGSAGIPTVLSCSGFRSRHSSSAISKSVSPPVKLARAGRPRILISVAPDSAFPPHYTLELGDEILDPGKGRNNLWRTLLLFFAYFRENENGQIRSISLGPSGLNLDWIFTS